MTISDDFSFIITLVFIALFILSATIVAVYFLERAACYSKADKMGFDHFYSFFAGCNYKINGTWVNSENWRSFE